MDATTGPQHGDTLPTACIVQGMHASGTAPLSCLISRLTRPDNLPTEGVSYPHLALSGSIAGLNRRILHDLGSPWSKPALLFVRGNDFARSAGLIREAVRARYLQSAVGLLRSSIPETGPLILEDPNISLMSDLWHGALQQLGYAVHTTHIFRNPLEVAASLKDSHKLQHSRAWQLWAHYNLSALTMPPERQPLLVSYADLMNTESDLLSLLTTHLSGHLSGAASPSSRQTIAADWHRLIELTAKEPVVPKRVVDRSTSIPSLIKRLYTLLTDWGDLSHEQRETAVQDLVAGFEEQSLFAGNLVAVKLPEPLEPVAPPASTEGNEPRKLLIHYHLFKNAGSSVDAILRRNFADRWINTEFAPRAQINHQDAIRDFVINNPHLAAISSHTLLMPVPKIEGVEILPIVFVRHPLDRLKSAYEFERRQDGTNIGSRIARETNFAGYLGKRLAIRGDRSCRDFQVARLAMAVPVKEGSELERALSAVDRLPFVGLVEAFKSSSERLQRLVQPMFADFQSFDVRENVTRTRHQTLEERLGEIRDELGEESFAVVMEANQADMVLYEKVRAMYAAAPQAATSSMATAT